MRRSRTFWAGSWAVFCTGSFLALSHCGGLEPVPPRFAVPTPAGGPDWFHCSGASRTPVAASTGIASPLAFDADLESWADRTGSFARAHPIHGKFVPAKDVDPHWDPSQLALFSDRGARRKNSLVPIGGTYWKDTPYPVANDPDAVWVSSAFVDVPGGLPRDEGDAATGAMAKVFDITTDYLRMSLGGDRDPDVGVELLVAPRSGRDLSGCEEQSHKALGRRPPGGHGYADYLPVFVRRGMNREDLEPIDLPMNDPRCPLKGLRAVLRVFDLSPTAHVNVGSIEPANVPLGESAARMPTPVWGFADFDTHRRRTWGSAAFRESTLSGARRGAAWPTTSGTRRRSSRTSRATFRLATTRTCSSARITAAMRLRR